MDSIKTLIDRWTNEQSELAASILLCLEGSSAFDKLHLATTSESLQDLRGLQIPKKDLLYGSKGKLPVGLSIKNKTFRSVDFSRADFKNCTFINCTFINSKFDKTQFNESHFWNCSFSSCDFVGTTFNYCSFDKSINLFKKVKFNFKDNTFRDVNFLETHFYKQSIANCVFIDCNLKAAILTKCILDRVTFQGQVSDFFVKQNKSAREVVFRDTVKTEINFFETNLDNFTFRN